jgi:hypothetical protein
MRANSNKIIIESKAEVKARLHGASPDFADALAMAVTTDGVQSFAYPSTTVKKVWDRIAVIGDGAPGCQATRTSGSLKSPTSLPATSPVVSSGPKGSYGVTRKARLSKGLAWHYCRRRSSSPFGG